MRDKPGGAELLKLARKILREQLLEHIPAQKKYSALMVANTMAIAARQFEFGDARERDELSRIAAILGEKIDPASSTEVQTALETCYRKLSADIREGKVGPGSANFEAVSELLHDQAKQKVRESNPGYLDE
ncbi:MAG TPA: DUF6285 domain-containing protein [Rhodospirillales bacterium]|nr:DUF6285 domain-containing protein [Rhodospirillales bacterium]|tara:strand:- start:100 stop:492 length:393 start_codon:yes stop_codon:yes gene_type:complete